VFPDPHPPSTSTHTESRSAATIRSPISTSTNPRRALETISASYGGARYLFASEAHRKTFLSNPKKYVPQFGGFCAVGTSYGQKVDIDPQTGKVVKGKLYVNNNPKAQAIFDKDTQGTISRAEHNWPVVKDKPL